MFIVTEYAALNGVYLSLKICFIFIYSAYADEMPPCETFHQGLYCLPEYLFTGIQNEKGFKSDFI